MEVLQTIWVWFITTASLGAVILAIFGANKLREKFPNEIEANWKNAVMPSIAFLLLHLGIWWLWPVFWTNWFNSNGFILMQVLIIAGFYTASLKTKPASVIGKGLILVALVGVGLGVWTTLTTNRPREVVAPVGTWSEEIPNTNGIVILPHGPILLQTDKEMVERDDITIKKEMTPPLQPARWVRFQSRAQEPVSVTVSK